MMTGSLQKKRLKKKKFQRFFFFQKKGGGSLIRACSLIRSNTVFHPAQVFFINEMSSLMNHVRLGTVIAYMSCNV